MHQCAGCAEQFLAPGAAANGDNERVIRCCRRCIVPGTNAGAGNVGVSTPQRIEQYFAFGLVVGAIVERDPEEQQVARLRIVATAKLDDIGHSQWKPAETIEHRDARCMPFAVELLETRANFASQWRLTGYRGSGALEHEDGLTVRDFPGDFMPRERP